MKNNMITYPYINSCYYLMQEYRAPEFMNYSYIMSVSGSATRMTWQYGFIGADDERNESELFISGDRLVQLRNIWKRCGMETITHFIIEEKSFWKENYSKPVRWISRHEGREKVLELIKEKPILILGDGCSYVGVGFSDNVLYGHRCVRNEIVSDSIVEISDWDMNMKGFCEVISFEPILPSKEVLYNTLITILNNMRISKRKWMNHISFGLDSINQLVEQLVWDETYQYLKPNTKYDGKIPWPKKKQGDHYIQNGARSIEDIYKYNICPYINMLECNQYFIDFLSSIAYEKEYAFFQKDIESIIMIYEEVMNHVNYIKSLTETEDILLQGIRKEIRYEMIGTLIKVKINLERSTTYMDKIIQGIDNIWQQKNVL